MAYDPTLPVSEADLIARVKTDRDSDALISLVSRHSGIYFSVVNRYAATYPNTIKARDMDDEKLFNIDRFICAYDPTRGCKLSTYIRESTDYLCKNALKKDSRSPLSLAGYVASGQAPIEREDSYQTTHGSQITLQDESSTARVTETANRDLAVEDIRRAASEVCTDQRFLQILECRHGEGEMSWREVGEKVGLSHERCRKLFMQNLALVKAHLNT